MTGKRVVQFVLCMMQFGFMGDAGAEYLFERDVKCDALASSELQSSKYAYSINNVKDGNPDTAWCEGNEKGGAGEWMQLDLHNNGDALSDGLLIKILPGYAKSITLYEVNERPSKIQITVTDKQSNKILGDAKGIFLTINDALEMQEFTVPLGQKVNLGAIRLKMAIEGVYKGTKYKDMCITEVQVFDKAALKRKIDSHERRRQSTLETAELKRLLPLAKQGKREAMQGLMRLVDGRYYRSAEGGEWLGEIYLELFYRYPEAFLFLLSKQSGSIRAKVEESIISPVVDTYSSQEIADKIRAVKSRNVTEAYKAGFVTKIKKIHGVK